ncbi:MAG: hypothetical protein RBS56_02745 [Candidatus Gracilibacteria bacterium]|jgi:hypothetical protein|nr:hypothetical protein [Candidatus Gracilibacteria bacterium]
MKKVIPLLTLLALTISACTISTANISEAKICSSVSGESMMCTSDETMFATDTPEIIVTTKLDNAMEGTKVTFTWRYLEGSEPELIDEITVESPDIMPSYPNSTMPIPPSGMWPTGKYDVVITLDTDNFEPIVKAFSVK